MHARKLPRISEPSFDRDYGNGSSTSSGKMSKNYRNDRRSSMSPSDRNMSPRDRVDRYKGGGGQGGGRRDRDRDRERDQREYYKYRSSRDRNRERSPKERKWDNRRSSGQVNDHRDQLRDQRIERDHRDQREHRERVMDQRDHHHHHHNQQQSSSGSTSTGSVRSVGDWSEHTSSSGKKYYYNCVSEVSRKYSKRQIFVQKFNFDKTPSIFTSFSSQFFF